MALFWLVACSAPQRVTKIPVSTSIVEKTGRVETVLLMTERIYNYAPNSAELQPHDKTELVKIAEAIAKNPNHYRRVEIIGHSDQTGSEDSNLDISRERALAVLELLRQAGVDRKKIRTSWLAGTEPLEEGTAESFINRRVEIKIFKFKN